MKVEKVEIAGAIALIPVFGLFFGWLYEYIFFHTLGTSFSGLLTSNDIIKTSFWKILPTIFMLSVGAIAVFDLIRRFFGYVPSIGSWFFRISFSGMIVLTLSFAIMTFLGKTKIDGTSDVIYLTNNIVSALMLVLQGIVLASLRPNWQLTIKSISLLAAFAAQTAYTAKRDAAVLLAEASRENPIFVTLGIQLEDGSPPYYFVRSIEAGYIVFDSEDNLLLIHETAVLALTQSSSKP